MGIEAYEWDRQAVLGDHSGGKQREELLLWIPRIIYKCTIQLSSQQVTGRDGRQVSKLGIFASRFPCASAGFDNTSCFEETLTI